MDSEKKIKKLLKVIGKIGIDSQDPRVLSLIEDLLEQDKQPISFETHSKTWLVGDEVWWWEEIFKVPQWGRIKEFDGDFAKVIRGGQELAKVSIKDLGALVGDSSAEWGGVTFKRGEEVKFKRCQMPAGYKMFCLDFAPENNVKVIVSGATEYAQWESLGSLDKL